MKRKLIGILLMVASFIIADSAGAKEVQQWTRFETAFISSRNYDNPVQEVRLSVIFNSPGGKQRQIQGFWDGGTRWLVRFSPDEPGMWTYTTKCTDRNNDGLNNVSGSFNCMTYSGDLEFYKHGALKLSDSRTYLAHDDGTPFFWLADTVWCGPLFSNYEDWKVFLKDRVSKEFTAIQFVATQWRMAKADAEGNVTYQGKDRISINPKYFKRLDKYIDAINDEGLLAVPVLLWAIEGDGNPGYILPEDQKIILAEYLIARFGSHQVLWFLGGDGNFSGNLADEWKRIGKTVFHPDQQRLATLHVRGKSWIGEEFRTEPWFHIIGYQSGHGDDEGTLRWLNQGPPSNQWHKKPVLPMINIEPNYEAHNGYTHNRVHNDLSVRRASYWSLLVSPTAGVTYGGQGIWGWHTKVQAPADHISTGLGSPWYEAKDLPGAFSMKYLHQFFRSIEWWRLVPAQELLMEQPGKQDASLFIAAAKSESGDLAVIYMPEGGQVTLNTGLLKPGLVVKWYHPRTGGWLDAEKTTSPEQTYQTFDRNDWILLFNAPVE